MSLTFLPGKLLISIVGRHKGEHFMAVAKAAGARGGTIANGRSVSDNRILQALLLADVHQDIVFTLMRGEAQTVITAVRAVCRDNPKKLCGIAMLLDVGGMLVRLCGNSAEDSVSATVARNKKMESGYTLLTIIVNHGCADDVMAKARAAGARGGTIMTGRGTGTEEDVKFFGVTLVPEKEVLMIVAENKFVVPIVEAIRTVPALADPGSGIVYSMNVEEFIMLGQ